MQCTTASRNVIEEKELLGTESLILSKKRASVSTQANVFEQQHENHQESLGNENYDTVYEMIRQSMDEDGINRDIIFNQVRTKMSVDEMDDAIDFLTNEGHIYSTRDEDHFRITDGD